jgi:hypothetical protein
MRSERTMSHRHTLFIALTTLLACTAVACGGDDVGSDEDAERAYKGLDASIDKAIKLGFDGFNAASNANIPEQTTSGAKSGTLKISGQVDQGASANKTMNLVEEMSAYSDDGALTYSTGGALPALSMKLSNIPTGTVDGTLDGTYAMTGDLEADVTVHISFAGELQPNAADMTKVERKLGTTHITGTATSGDGVYDIDLTR